MKHYFIILFLLYSMWSVAQRDTCLWETKILTLQSSNLAESRDIWVSLPYRYDSEKEYPVIYVLDAEWRFDIVRSIAHDLAGSEMIPQHIIVGIPHIDWRNKRQQDLTFNETDNIYNGDSIDTRVFNNTNAGGADRFFRFLTQEVCPKINKMYKTTGNNMLVGHSLGGYFASYISPMNHEFTSLLIADPSIWYSKGHTITQVKDNIEHFKKLNIYIGYQPKPSYHKNKIQELIYIFESSQHIDIHHHNYENLTHNGMFVFCVLDGLKQIYAHKN